MAFSRTTAHTTASDATFSAAGSSAWNLAAAHTLAVSGADVGGIPYCPTATTETTSANLTYTETSGPRLQVGSSGTSTGAIVGYFGASGYFGIWNSVLTPSASNFALAQGSGGDVTLNGSGSGACLALQTGATNKMTFTATAGAGPSITAGTATTDVNALSVTGGANNAAVANFINFVWTDTTSAATANALRILGGTGAATNLCAVHKTGAMLNGAVAFTGVPSSPVTGQIINITDSNTATWGATIAGGGANNVLARYNGTNWTVVGA